MPQAVTVPSEPVASVDDAGSRSTFAALVDAWRAERPRGADVAAMTDTAAYQAIIQMGEPAVPLLLAELSRRVDHWFCALHAITGENPVPPEAEGKLTLMAAAWLRWGRGRGYIGNVD